MKEITNDNFQELVLDSEKLVILDMWAPWCQPCKIIAPVLEKLSTEHPDVDFLKCNVDENPDIAVKYNIRGIPALLFIKNGETKDMLVGVVPKNVIVEKINQF